MVHHGHTTTTRRSGHSALSMAFSALAWISAVIVMGVLAYLVSRDWRGDQIIYVLVIVSCFASRVTRTELIPSQSLS
jgi:hypothetical protein